ncbi:MAG: hypothetical protein KBC64_05775 [Simkaniaceae bacterium]|nr:hypothetical protein [Simkaniaceae bacterium]
MRFLGWLLVSSSLCAGFLDNERVNREIERGEAWFTGSLLSFNGHTMAAGHTEYRPSLLVTDKYGTLDNRWQNHSSPQTFSISPTLSITQGIFDWLDLQAIASVQENRHGGAHSTRLGDVSLYIGFQALEDRRGDWVPDVKVMFGESFPSGSYQRLSPKKNMTDASGSGSYESMVALVIQKLFHVRGTHFIRSRFFASYMFPTSLRVHSFNRYGGGYETSARVYPGIKWSGIASFEYSMSQSFAFSLDFAGYYAQKASFKKGIRGKTATGGRAHLGFPKGGEFSVAPAIEYNWSKNCGLIFGVWFTLAGQSDTSFTTGIVTFNIVH